MATPEMIAYAAGFFDGEGTVDIRYRTTHGGRYDRFELRIAISQLATNVLDWLVEHFGGSWHTRNKNTNVSVWVLTGPPAVDFLGLIRPYLIVKAAQADVAFEFGAIGVNCKNTYFSEGKKGFHRLPVELWNARRDVMLGFELA